jgi:hypothetical protein
MVVGRRFRLRKDAQISSMVRYHLTEDQLEEGVEGIVLDGDDLHYEVRLENVPKSLRIPAQDCQLLPEP